MKYSQISFIMFFVLVSSTIISTTDGKRSISKAEEDDIEIERELRVLNKKPVKTITIDDGDIIDCVDIYKQPAFDNPLLKNHKIEMNPSSIPGETTNKTISSSSSIFRGLQWEGCPSGTVPIRRTTRKDLVSAKHFLKKTKSINANDMAIGYVYAEEVIQEKKYFGGTASMSVHDLTVKSNQHVTSQIWIMNGPPKELNSIEFGIMDSATVFGDSRSRLFGSWTSVNGGERIGCYNMMCPGFVQYSPTVYFGHRFSQPSIYGQISYDVHLRVFRSNRTGHWWLTMGPNAQQFEPVGYWPSELFTHLRNSASSVRYGGVAVALSGASTPPMGNGYLPQLEDYKKTAYMRLMKYVNETGESVNLDPHSMQTAKGPTPQCYDILLAGQLEAGWDIAMMYGGPGGTEVTECVHS
ncbi:hypothetical protein MKX01_014596 [Papaver californicum]|nr:hypothetical protein MKX01_014596 [Papaver californicum]